LTVEVVPLEAPTNDAIAFTSATDHGVDEPVGILAERFIDPEGEAINSTISLLVTKHSGSLHTHKYVGFYRKGQSKLSLNGFSLRACSLMIQISPPFAVAMQGHSLFCLQQQSA